MEISTSLIISFLIGAGFLYVLQSAKIKRYKKQSLTDELTGLYNAREFKNRFRVELERSKRYQLPFSILLIDVDKFKTINDTYGYKTGDNLLRALAAKIQSQLRTSDILFRYKMGDELMIMAMNTNKYGAQKLASRIKESIQTHHFIKKQKITVSIGISEFKASSPKKDMEQEAEQNLKTDKSLINSQIINNQG